MCTTRVYYFFQCFISGYLWKGRSKISPKEESPIEIFAFRYENIPKTIELSFSKKHLFSDAMVFGKLGTPNKKKIKRAEMQSCKFLGELAAKLERSMYVNFTQFVFTADGIKPDHSNQSVSNFLHS